MPLQLRAALISLFLATPAAAEVDFFGYLGVM